MALHIHPVFDVETRTWFVDGLTGEAESIRELLRLLPKREDGYHVEGYRPSGAPPITLPKPGKPVRGNSNFSYSVKKKPFAMRPETAASVASESAIRKPSPLPSPPPVLKSKQENFVWTPERNEEFKRLVRSGVRDIEIAAAWGLTRNAVIGKRHRLRI